MKKFFLSPRFLLPLTIVVGVLVMGVRFVDMWGTVESGKLSFHPAQAEEAKAAPASTTATTAASAKPDKMAAPAPAKPEMAKSEMVEPQKTEPAMGLMPPPDADASNAEVEVLKQLADRREQLEKRARDLDTRDSLLKVTEQRVDQKIKEMETLRLQLQSMVNQGNEAQQAQTENLVKIYETMKPDEAAKIFETLDMPVLLGVIQKMKPARTAPIMAKMAPEKAREVTVALTKQDQLPQIK